MATYVSGTIRMRLFSQRGHNRIMRDIHENTMEAIKYTLWPFHFETLAFNRYPEVFQKRTKKYQMMKARVVHHQRPNEFTGALKIAVLADSVIARTAKGGSLSAKAPLDSMILSGPRAGQRIRRPLTEQRRREIEFVSDAEIQNLQLRQEQQYMAGVYDPANATVVLKKFR